jgi:hypothetical protein
MTKDGLRLRSLEGGHPCYGFYLHRNQRLRQGYYDTLNAWQAHRPHLYPVEARSYSNVMMSLCRCSLQH